VVVHACNPGSWKVEGVGSQDQGQPWLHGETLFQKTKTKSNQHKKEMNV
jgi:hypothetical protein